MLEIQKFLKNPRFPTAHEAREALKRRYSVNILVGYLNFKNGGYETVYIYNYDLLTSRGAEIIENEARALILNESHDLVSCSFMRFMNYHERNAASIKWSDRTVAEKKYDGTLIVVYEYKGEVFVQTRKTPNALGTIQNSNRTYYEAVLETLFPRKLDIFKSNVRDLRYIHVFEYVGPENRHVTPYEEEDLVLLAKFAINDSFGGSIYEVDRSTVDHFAERYEFKRPETIKVSCPEDAEKIVRNLDPLEEGIVVVDFYGNRIKIKNPGYLAISKAVNAGGELRAKHLARIVLNADASEFSSYFPEYKKVLTILTGTLYDMFLGAETLYERNRHCETRKEFAMAVKDSYVGDLVFGMYDGKITNMDDALEQVKPERLVQTALKAEFNKELVEELKKLRAMEEN
jgi:hypothetical protein